MVNAQTNRKFTTQYFIFYSLIWIFWRPISGGGMGARARHLFWHIRFCFTLSHSLGVACVCFLLCLFAFLLWYVEYVALSSSFGIAFMVNSAEAKDNVVYWQRERGKEENEKKRRKTEANEEQEYRKFFRRDCQVNCENVNAYLCCTVEAAQLSAMEQPTWVAMLYVVHSVWRKKTNKHMHQLKSKFTAVTTGEARGRPLSKHNYIN